MLCVWFAVRFAAPEASLSSAQVFVCRSGSAADTQNISAYVAHYLRQHEMDVGEPDVATAANIAMQIVYGNKARSRIACTVCRRLHVLLSLISAVVERVLLSGQCRPAFALQTPSVECTSANGSQARDVNDCYVQNNLSAGMIVAGHDARDGGSVYALPLGGTLVKVPFSIGERSVCLGSRCHPAVRFAVSLRQCHGACAILTDCCLAVSYDGRFCVRRDIDPGRPSYHLP